MDYVGPVTPKFNTICIYLVNIKKKIIVAIGSKMIYLKILTMKQEIDDKKKYIATFKNI